MMAAIFISYAAIIWLVFAKLKLFRLSLPIALILATVGPTFAFYILLSMNNYHPSSSDARVFQRIVQIVPHITTAGRVQEIHAKANSPMKEATLFSRLIRNRFRSKSDGKMRLWQRRSRAYHS